LQAIAALRRLSGMSSVIARLGSCERSLPAGYPLPVIGCNARDDVAERPGQSIEITIVRLSARRDQAAWQRIAA